MDTTGLDRAAEAMRGMNAASEELAIAFGAYREQIRSIFAVEKLIRQMKAKLRRKNWRNAR